MTRCTFSLFVLKLGIGSSCFRFLGLQKQNRPFTLHHHNYLHSSNKKRELFPLSARARPQARTLTWTGARVCPLTLTLVSLVL